MIVHGISRQASLALNEAWLYRMAMSVHGTGSQNRDLKVIREIDLSILSSLHPARYWERRCGMYPDRAERPAEALLLDREKRSFTRICDHAAAPEQDQCPELAAEGEAFEVIRECRPRIFPISKNRRPGRGMERN